MIFDPDQQLLSGGGYAEYVNIHESLAMVVPDALSVREVCHGILHTQSRLSTMRSQAAAIPETWLTAFQLLHTLGNIKAGENVLVRCNYD